MTAVNRAFAGNSMSHSGFGSPQADMIENPFPAFVFNHGDDKDFWCRIHPETRQDVNPQDTKLFSSLKQQLEHEFDQIPGRQLPATIKFIKRCLGIGMNDENDPVKVESFLRLTKWFGSFTRRGETCIFLEQIWNLMCYTLNQGAARVSPFAGMITQEKAESYLRPDDVIEGSYLVRFSESLANRGGFSLAVKVDATAIRHYNIVGDPSQASTGRVYNARLKLIHRQSLNLNDEEQEFHNIVDFMNNRTDDEIEDNIYCNRVCPDLPFNALFRGYD